VGPRVAFAFLPGRLTYQIGLLGSDAKPPPTAHHTSQLSRHLLLLRRDLRSRPDFSQQHSASAQTARPGLGPGKGESGGRQEEGLLGQAGWTWARMGLSVTNPGV